MQLAIVCPCYNEEAVIRDSAQRLGQLLTELANQGSISANSFILLVNDGSRDTTWQCIEDAHRQDPRIRGANLKHNVGHQYALMAGLMLVRAECDAAITIDVDLQDDLQAIPSMVKAYLQGHDAVYGVKVNRRADPPFKRGAAKLFYRIQRKLGVKAVYNHADFRLMSRGLLEQLSAHPERNLYLRGLVPSMAKNPTTVNDTISSRRAGTSKYTFSKSLSLALDGITSFSIKPLRLISLAGLLSIVVGVIVGGYVVYSLVQQMTVRGWASLMCSIWLIGGMLLMSIGVVGEYIGKIYIEVKHRPRFQIGEYLGGNPSDIDRAQLHDS